LVRGSDWIFRYLPGVGSLTCGLGWHGVCENQIVVGLISAEERMAAQFTFEPLTRETLSNAPRRRRGTNTSNLIEGGRVVVLRTEATSRQGNQGPEPYLDIRRSGEIVESIVVHCPCGRKTAVVLEYGESVPPTNP